MLRSNLDAATSPPSPVASVANAPEVESKAWQSGAWAVVAFELQKSSGPNLDPHPLHAAAIHYAGYSQVVAPKT